MRSFIEISPLSTELSRQARPRDTYYNNCWRKQKDLIVIVDNISFCLTVLSAHRRYSICVRVRACVCGCVLFDCICIAAFLRNKVAVLRINDTIQKTQRGLRLSICCHRHVILIEYIRE